MRTNNLKTLRSYLENEITYIEIYEPQRAMQLWGKRLKRSNILNVYYEIQQNIERNKPIEESGWTGRRQF